MTQATPSNNAPHASRDFLYLEEGVWLISLGFGSCIRLIDTQVRWHMTIYNLLGKPVVVGKKKRVKIYGQRRNLCSLRKF
jgi:hypothetical protein